MTRCNIKEMGYIDRDWEHYEFREMAAAREKIAKSLIEELRE